jgi:hypothetical protein
MGGKLQQNARTLKIPYHPERGLTWRAHPIVAATVWRTGFSNFTCGARFEAGPHLREQQLGDLFGRTAQAFSQRRALSWTISTGGTLTHWIDD